MLLKELVKNIEYEYISGNLDIEITGIAYDSRKIMPGNLFVCIKGFIVDGHSYITEAIKNGAVAVLVEDNRVEELTIPAIKVQNSRRALALASGYFYHNPSTKFTLIGVTGTNGKTTTTYLIKSILEQAGRKVGLIGTNQNVIGDEILPSERTTPESLELQQIFNEMVNKSVDCVIMEVSSHSLELNRVDGCNFDIGIFTNITQDHLDFHETMEKYLQAKAKLFNLCKKGIINIDDVGSQYILKTGTCKMMTFGIEHEADFYAENMHMTSEQVQFDIKTPKGITTIELGIPGKFSIYNALGSIAACLVAGIELKYIQMGLKKAKGVPGRVQVVDTKKDFTLIIDYAHTPDGLENVLNTVRGFAKARVLTLFGCGGDRDHTKRPIMGKIAGEGSDFCIITSDNPRTEDPFEILGHIEEGIKNTNCPYIVIENRYKAIEYALRNAKKNDVIILAGKGHETYQILKDKTIEFNEEKIVKEILKND